MAQDTALSNGSALAGSNPASKTTTTTTTTTKPAAVSSNGVGNAEEVKRSETDLSKTNSVANGATRSSVEKPIKQTATKDEKATVTETREVVLERFPWKNIGSFNEGKKFDSSYVTDSYLIKQFVTETFRGDWYWNVVLVVGLCFFSWLIARVRFGFFGFIFVLLCASSVYRAEYRRFERNVRDDILRINARERLEKKFETMEWLNNFLMKFWVIYMPALSETVMTIANETLKDLAPGYGIDALSLDEFTLGSKAPRIDSIKSYTKKGKDIVEWDWAFRFTPNDTSDMTKNEIDRKIDPKVALGVRVGKAMISKKLPILVEDMSVSGRAKITLELSADFPHIRLVSVSILEPPEIDFSLKPVGGDTFGLDVMSLVPGLKTLIKTLINSNVGPMLYAPNQLDVNVEELTAQAVPEAIGVVAVTTKGADFNESITPYVQISTGGDLTKYSRTDIKTKSNKACWNETKYILVNSLSDKLNFDVYDFSMEKKKGLLFGSHEVELGTLLQRDDLLDQKFPIELAGKKKGTINYDIRWFPTLSSKDDSEKEEESKESETPDSDVGIFKFTLRDIKGLNASGTVTGKLNPKAELHLNGELVKEFRTLKNANEPSWEATTEVLVTEKTQSLVALTITDTGARDGVVIDSFKDSLENLAFNCAEGKDVFTMDKGSKVRLSAVWKPLSLSGAGSTHTPPIGTLRLHLRNAEQLLNLETVGDVDPYCKVLLSNRLKYQTAFHPDTCEPTFNELVYIPLTSTSQHVSLEVMDYQKVSKDRSLGSAIIPISQFIKKDSNGNFLFHDGSKDILSASLSLKKKKPKGTIYYSVSFIPAIPVYSLAELNELEEQEKTLALTKKQREEEAKGWEELYKKSPNDYEWIEIEDKEQAMLSKKEKMSLDQLLTYRSGSLIIHTVGGKLKKNGSFLQVLVDDQSSPSFVSTKSAGTKLDNQFGEAFIRDLPNSTFTIRNSKGRVVKDEEDILAQTTLKTIDLLKNGFDAPRTISFEGASVTIQFEYLPSAIKLPPSETILDTGKAKIEFLDAQGLKSADRNGKSDPFVSVMLGDIELFKSKVVKKTLNPTWNEGTTLPFMSRSRTQMQLKVMDWDRAGKNELIGETKLDISGVQPLTSETVTFKLHPQGTVRAKVTFSPEYIRPKVGAKEFGLNMSYLAGAPLKGVGAAANLATGAVGAGAGVVGAGAGAVTGGVGASADLVSEGVGNITKGGSSLIKSVLGGKKSHKGRPSMDESSSLNGDAKSVNSRATGHGSHSAIASAMEQQHQRTASQTTTFTQAAKGKKSTEGTLIIHNGKNLGKEAQLKVSLAINGTLKTIYKTKKTKATSGVIRWDDEVSFDAPKEAEVVFGGVVHHTFSKDTELGTATIKLSEVIDSPREITLSLGQGEISVSFRYSPDPDEPTDPAPPADW
ncbi:hypothetical protein BN1211_1579 [Cyberlindnera jadinii]|uniref:Tricalbin n=1 Tax=Cyberlindnera jadinii (strain ATCC 18201 / CBS 1600 / BCRC 20928 / JCM 3617 / NBRC 0987 / NRRL Y-1542) TaxID=983966 RepID=A0A0H5C1D4_CYBJN|nr:hypothetical protein BN1211_1579 [Cyberlindnera jadinii]